MDRLVKLEREKYITKIKEDIDKAVEKHILGLIPGSAADIDKHRQKLRDGEYDNIKIEVASFRLERPPQFPMFKGAGLNMMPSRPQLNKRLRKKIYIHIHIYVYMYIYIHIRSFNKKKKKKKKTKI
ncbi:hypothetical protein RFI_26276 [Reticulomyxa filosa]|uniref:Uncharacterized protein n=1 Tax=Reticulomyxa filosa TaxID=46433 RepID=X6MDH6_RETFI|nr:hypothetical protein RFI_26276 [Reticulomyxa filosa]|eukprot:ETO11100.1 hypothetical protein RFI_26276 [Reticulomyxa filosa]